LYFVNYGIKIASNNNDLWLLDLDHDIKKDLFYSIKKWEPKAFSHIEQTVISGYNKEVRAYTRNYYVDGLQLGCDIVHQESIGQSVFSQNDGELIINKGKLKKKYESREFYIGKIDDEEKKLPLRIEAMEKCIKENEQGFFHRLCSKPKDTALALGLPTVAAVGVFFLLRQCQSIPMAE
jgi:hypothetical protein